MLDRVRNHGGLTGGQLILAFVLVLLVMAGAYWLASWLLMWGWNTFVPAIFGLPVINQWMAFAMVVVGGIVGGFFKPTVTNKVK